LKKLHELSPQALLVTVLLLSLLPFALVALFPAWFHHALESAAYLFCHNIGRVF